MKFKLINDMITPQDNAIETILHNRGIKNIKKYIETTDEVINSPELLGEKNLKTAAATLIKTISEEKSVLVIVDADCDGYTSSAILINYLYKIFPAFVQNNLKWFIHSAKQHGLSDCIEEALNYDLVICPDSSSNDYLYHKRLKDANIPVIVLDHHEADKISEDAIIINNQLSDYPNKEFSGAGVTWQFCRYLDKLTKNDYANEFLDLVALGNMADMVSMRSLETKHLIHKGFKKENVKNPFIFEMAEKNSFSLNKDDYVSYLGLKCTPMGAAFFIAPFVNAMVRSGTQQEKELLFNSMLIFKAFEMIDSTKRGHSFGEQERLVDQAVRTCTNVKNRQTRAQDAGMELLEGLIEQNNMMEHSVLLFLLEPGQIDRNIAGLVANKFMSKYQRPVCILTKVDTNGEISYQGSARGYGVGTMFKDLCSVSGASFAEGHQGAFGLGIPAQSISKFISSTDEALTGTCGEPTYLVDYIFNEHTINSQIILDIADMNDYWGKDMDRPWVCVNFKITPNNFTVMKGNTLKFTLPDGTPLIKFKGTEEEIENFTTEGFIEINAICKCNRNTWGNFSTAQLLIEDYEIVNSVAYMF